MSIYKNWALDYVFKKGSNFDTILLFTSLFLSRSVDLCISGCTYSTTFLPSLSQLLKQQSLLMNTYQRTLRTKKPPKVTWFASRLWTMPCYRYMMALNSEATRGQCCCLFVWENDHQWKLSTLEDNWWFWSFYRQIQLEREYQGCAERLSWPGTSSEETEEEGETCETWVHSESPNNLLS